MSAVATATPASVVAPAAASPVPASAGSLRIRVEFSGGLELLFSRQKSLALTLAPPANGGEPLTMRWLIEHLKTTYCTERQELFVQEDSVRPGILVLVNDTDWELEDGLEYRLKDGDTIVFISTLHGG